MSLRRFELLATRLVVAMFFAVAPSYVPAWRTDPKPPPGLVLAVGLPVPWIGGKR